MNIDLLLEAFADPTRRDLFERIVVRPRRAGELVAEVSFTRSAVSYHLKILKEAGLVYEAQDRLYPSLEPLPYLRAYFDRLWLEATLGDGWLMERRAAMSDFGL